MPDITNPLAIKFSDERVRTSADRLAQAYDEAVDLKTRWDALGGGATALAVMAADIQDAASRFTEFYKWCLHTEKLWFIHDSTTLIPNTADAVVDQSPGDGRPANTGAKCNNVMTRVIEFQNWMLSLAGSFTDVTRVNVGYLNSVIKASREGPTIDTTIAGDFINRCSELKTNYEASSNANLNTLLALAVNPNS